MIMFDKDQEFRQDVTISIKVVGIGGAGNNTVNSMINSDLKYIDFIVTNTDSQTLNRSKALKKIQLGKKATKGLGSGANPDLGRRATEEDLDKIMEVIGDADIVFLAAGMGGGTGSGGAPVIAKALKEKGILSIAVVTKPFAFEGKRRMAVADEALELLKKEVDTLIIVPNQKLLDVVDRSVSMIEAFSMIDDLLIHSVKSISDIITQPGHINVDFADLKAIMKGMGLAMMGAGCAQGENRAVVAAQQAIASHLIENMDIKKARGILLNITGGHNLTLHEINDAASVIYDESNDNAHIILGSVIDLSLGDKVMVSVIATGFESPAQAQPLTYATALNDKKIVDIHMEQFEQIYPETSVQNSTTMHIQETIITQTVPTNFQKMSDLLDRSNTSNQSILQMVEQDNFGQTHSMSHSPAQQIKQQRNNDADSLDIPAFLRKSQVADDSLLEIID